MSYHVWRSNVQEAQPKGHLAVRSLATCYECSLGKLLRHDATGTDLQVFVCSDEFEIACGCAICYSVFAAPLAT